MSFTWRSEHLVSNIYDARFRSSSRLTYKKLSSWDDENKPVKQIDIESGTAEDHKWKNILFKANKDGRPSSSAERVITVDPPDTDSSKYLCFRFNYRKSSYYYMLMEKEPEPAPAQPSEEPRRHKAIQCPFQ